MNLPKKPRILYFIDGSVHVKEDLLDAQQYALGKVEYRNARLVESVESDVDGVAARSKGVIPPCYRNHPTGAEAIEEYQEAIAATRKASGDSVAPVPTTAKADRPEFGKDEAPAKSETKSKSTDKAKK